MGKLDVGLADEIGRAVEDRRDAAIHLLQELVRIPSVTGDEGVSAFEKFLPIFEDLKTLEVERNGACLLVEWCGAADASSPD
ncbi:MAG TPA: hypothetical protein VK869_07860 [Rubrobacteraceae bacterium]|nr:hypothetical protein [Rubrobacteraceae bacterium]